MIDGVGTGVFAQLCDLDSLKRIVLFGVPTWHYCYSLLPSEGDVIVLILPVDAVQELEGEFRTCLVNLGFSKGYSQSYRLR